MSGLNPLIQRLQRMGGEGIRYAVSAKLAVATGELYRAGFERQADPYGDRWALRKDQKRRSSSNPVLTGKTGYLRVSGEPTSITSTGFRFRVYAPYGRFHEYGTRYMPMRPIMPKANFGLGTWGPAYRAWVGSAIRGLLR